MDKIKIAGGENASQDALYIFDKDLGKTPEDVRLAQEVTTDNP